MGRRGYVEQPSNAKVQYVVRRLSKKQPGCRIMLAPLGAQMTAKLETMTLDVAEGTFSIISRAVILNALAFIGPEACNTLHSDPSPPTRSLKAIPENAVYWWGRRGYD